jgi:hypothetical protein
VSEKGIDRNRWIEVVFVHALDGDGKLRAEIVMRIDWERNELHVKANKNAIELGPADINIKPVSVAIEEIIDFFKKKASEAGWVTHWSVRYVPGVDHALVDRELGLMDNEMRDWAAGDTIHVYGESPQKLDELSIDLRVVLPPAPEGEPIQKKQGTVKRVFVKSCG